MTASNYERCQGGITSGRTNILQNIREDDVGKSGTNF